MSDDIRKFAEKLYRKEHPREFPFSPYERQRELSDLWPQDQANYVNRVEAFLDLWKEART